MLDGELVFPNGGGLNVVDDDPVEHEASTLVKMSRSPSEHNLQDRFEAPSEIRQVLLLEDGLLEHSGVALG